MCRDEKFQIAEYIGGQLLIIYLFVLPNREEDCIFQIIYCEGHKIDRDSAYWKKIESNIRKNGESL